MPDLTYRVTTLPLLRNPSVADDRLPESLAQLAAMNRILGGYGGAFSALFPYMERNQTRPVRILDVGTGLCDVPAFLLQDTGIRRWDVDFVGIDASYEGIVAARTYLHTRLDRSVANRAAVHVADPANLPYPDDAFDIAMSSLFLNRFDPRQARAIAAEMDRVARDGVLITDLVRNELFLFAVTVAVHLLPTTPLVRNDAPLSVERGSLRPELYRIARKAGLSNIRIRSRWAMRLQLISGRL